jgi:hypothetical protein
MIFKQYFFWAALASFLYTVIKFYKPDFPLSLDQLIGVILFILALFGLQVEKQLRARGFLPKNW